MKTIFNLRMIFTYLQVRNNNKFIAKEKKNTQKMKLIIIKELSSIDDSYDNKILA